MVISYGGEVIVIVRQNINLPDTRETYFDS